MNMINSILSKNINKELISYFLELIEKNPMEYRKRDVSIGLNPNVKKQKVCLVDLYSPEKVNGEIEAQNDLYKCEEYGIISILYKDKKNYFPLYKRKAIIKFNLDFENQCRQILNKHITNYKLDWILAIEKSNLDNKIKEALKIVTPIEIENKNANEIIERIFQYLLLKRGNDYVREASAYIFWGASKILDFREDIWNILRIKQHPIQILSYCGTQEKNILFIENKQTFESLQKIEIIRKKYILIYLSGFMGTASRLNSKEYRSIYLKYSDECNFEIDLNEILDSNNYSKFFWGDLDYEGINIFIALRKVFNDVQLWIDGYELMANKLLANEGHKAELVKKENQKYPSNLTNIDYIDNYLLSLMSENGFYDQEGILF